MFVSKVRIVRERATATLEAKINDILAYAATIPGFTLTDIKLSEDNSGYTALIIYQINNRA